MKHFHILLLLILLGSGCTVIEKVKNKINPKPEPTKTVAVEPPSLIATGEIPTLISRQFKFTEGPAVDSAGNIYFTDQPNNKIWKYDTDGKLTMFLDKAGRSNGLYIDESGNIIACADEQNQLWSISPKKKITVLVKNLKGKKLNGPNDIWINPTNGDIYFTDPYYQRYYWKRRTTELDGEKVYVLRKGAKEAIVASSIFKKPNGIIGTPDGRHVFVADADDNKTYKFDIAPDGTLINGKVFAEQGSDGMTIDSKGNIYLTGIGITIYDPQGNKLQHIDIDEPWTANVCFGGKDRDMLFITASTALYMLKMKVKGAY